MSLISCIEMGQLIERKAAGLGEADSLRLERHLEGCESCRKTADFLRTFDDLSAAVPRLDAQRTDSILRAALVGFEASRLHKDPRARSSRRNVVRRLGSLSAGAAVAAAVVLLTLVLGGDLRGRSAFSPPQVARDSEHAKRSLPFAVPGAAVPLPEATRQEGRLETIVTGALVEARLPAAVPVVANEASRVSLGGFSVTLDVASQIRWQPLSLTLNLDQGSLRVRRVAARTTPLRIVTPSFEVRSLGGGFETDGVMVLCNRGQIEVLSPSGQSFGVLRAGQSLRVARPRRDGGQPDDALRLAQEALRAGHAQEARSLLSEKLEDPEPGNSAIALHLLLANAALAIGDAEIAREALRKAAAIRGIGFSREIALFAAASGLQGDDPRVAISLYRRYLARFPTGHYGAESARRLRAFGVALHETQRPI